MEELLLDIVRALRADPGIDGRGLTRIINAHSNRLPGSARFSKKQLAPFYLRVKAEDPERWRSWSIDAATEKHLLQLIQMKPRRTASGVATITVITKPWTCSGACLFCPADVRMPKSYLHAEPACQRAERNWFDPYLQVSSRLRTLVQMGHATDKVELIVLGGTFDDYPEAYRIWFVEELFRALNDGGSPAPRGDGASDDVETRQARYRAAGIARDEETLESQVREVQRQVTAGTLPFNEAVRMLYGNDGPWGQVAAWQHADLESLAREQQRNENAAHRCVGLVVETRPDHASPENLTLLRRLGCTKVQVGVQTLQPGIIGANGRGVYPDGIRRTFELLRLFGFKIHAHFMVNLPGATPDGDRADYRAFTGDAAFQPDEVKLYPCALIGSAPLARMREASGWQPYDEETLVGVLADDVMATPAFTRISRMIRDFSAGDIMAGNKKTNLRQLVEARLREQDANVREIRYREPGTDGIDAHGLELQDIAYRTTATDERFLQWVDSGNRIAGFLRLSLPDPAAAAAWGDALPVAPGEAMIREVHVYGRVARLGEDGASGYGGAQHLGLGRALVSRACEIARNAGYRRINVISAVGTRGYYRKLGFEDGGLYQRKDL